jgi:AcrR family transcriptional regulator
MAASGRPREFDRDAALKSAMLLFWQKGFVATSMKDLCDAMGILSTSLYAAFGSKEDLYREAIEHYVALGKPLWDNLAEAGTAHDGVQRLLYQAANECLPGSQGCPAGCMAMLAAVGDAWPDTIAEDVRKIRLDCLGKFKTRLHAAVAQGELPASTDVDRLSRFYLGVFQGMSLQARDGARLHELRSIAETAMAAWPMVFATESDTGKASGKSAGKKNGVLPSLRRPATRAKRERRGR